MATIFKEGECQLNDKITTFKLHWYNCSECCADDVNHEIITIYRNKKKMSFLQYNGYDSLINSEQINLNKAEVENFFKFLEKNATHWKSDYRVMVCDGSMWKVQMWHSSHKVTKVDGTIAYPPMGKKIEKYICTFIKNTESLVDPRLFGC